MEDDKKVFLKKTPLGLRVVMRNIRLHLFFVNFLSVEPLDDYALFEAMTLHILNGSRRRSDHLPPPSSSSDSFRWSKRRLQCPHRLSSPARKCRWNILKKTNGKDCQSDSKLNGALQENKMFTFFARNRREESSE